MEKPIEERPQRITVQVVKGEFCLNGHLVKAEPTGELDAMILHRCGEYTWESGNYCIECGMPLRATF